MLLLLLIAAICALSSILLARGFIHVLQLESYKLPQTLLWMRDRVGSWLMRPLAIAVICIGMRIILAMLLPVFTIPFFYLAAITQLIASYSAMKREMARATKKPLVMTMRVKRLFGFVSLVALAISLLLFAIPMPNVIPGPWWQNSLVNEQGLLAPVTYPQPLMGIWTLLTPVFAPLIVLLAALLAQPLETLIKRRYFLDARARLLARNDLIRIGITGSFGKTSVKFILATLLGEKYNVLATPASYNTPMGVTRTIREMLKPEHQVFICEMGAKQSGDIAELCGLVSPTYGMITSIGKQHLDTFKSLDNIIHTKYELIEALPDDGVACFPDDGGICKQLYESCPLSHKLLSGFDPSLFVRAENIRVVPTGSQFTLVIGEDTIACETRLLGRHNILNIVNACAMAYALGLSMPQIAAGIRKIVPVEHRLQIVPTHNGVTVIDDAFNSNPAGAKAAMDVLKAFPQRRIVITPGMVELGAEEATLNEVFGHQIAQSVDIAILIGPKRTRPIAKGILNEGFPKENLHIVPTLDEATSLLGKLMCVGDTVLFENDLPDTYNE